MHTTNYDESLARKQLAFDAACMTYTNLNANATKQQIRLAANNVADTSKTLCKYLRRQLNVERRNQREIIIKNEEKYAEKHIDIAKRYETLMFRSDVTFSCKGGTVPGVKSQLGEFSEVFRTMFSHDMLEARTSTVNFDRFEIDAVRILVHFCCGSSSGNIGVRLVPPSVFLDIAKIAGEFLIPRLLVTVSCLAPSWEISLEVFRLASLHCSHGESPGTHTSDQWESLHDKAAIVLSQLLRENPSHNLLQELTIDEVFELHQWIQAHCPHEILEMNCCNDESPEQNSVSHTPKLTICIPLNSEEGEKSGNSHCCSDVFEYTGSNFQIIILGDSITSCIPVLRMVSSPKLGSMVVPARSINFRVCEVSSKEQFSLLKSPDYHKDSDNESEQNSGSEEVSSEEEGDIYATEDIAASTSSAILQKKWSSYVFHGQFSCIEEDPDVDISRWCAQLLIQHSNKSLKELLKTKCEIVVLHIQLDPENSLLDLMVSWANKQHSGFADIFEAWNFLDQHEGLSDFNKKELQKDFIEYASKTFECHLPFRPMLGSLKEETFGLLLSQDSLFVSSEIVTLHALLQWSQVSTEKMLPQQLTDFFAKYDIWGCLKNASNGPFGRVHLLEPEKQTEKAPVCNLLFADTKVEEHPIEDIFCYRDIQRLLPLVRFPFIEKDKMRTDCQKVDIDYIKHLPVGMELLTEAAYIQLTPKKRKQSALECINASLEHSVSKICRLQYTCLYEQCTCKEEINLLRKEPRLHGAFTIPDISFTSNTLFNIF